MNDTDVIERLRGGIIVSCQATSEDPTFGAGFMTAFALSAKRGGAVGIRANSPEDIRAIRQAVRMPIIGIWKRPGLDGKGHIITHSLEDALALKAAGADIIALDAADRPRPGGVSFQELVAQIHSQAGLPVMADCASITEARLAQQAGVALIGSTRVPPQSQDEYRPNLEVIESFVGEFSIPVIAEGNFWNPADVARAIDIGVHAIVIGSAITRPWLITERYVKSLRA